MLVVPVVLDHLSLGLFSVPSEQLQPFLQVVPRKQYPQHFKGTLLSEK